MTAEIDRVRPLIRTRQYRHYTSDPVTEDELRALAEVARWSGSGRNAQPWRFIVVRDVDVVRRIAEAGMPQTRSLHTATAAFAITLPDDGREGAQAYDEGRVAERVLIGASMLGLGAGIAWIRHDVRAVIGALVGIPDGRYVRTILSIGRPSPEGKAPKSAPGEARLPLDELVTWR
jgi:nitroreductase